MQCRTLVPDAITYNFASHLLQRADGGRLLRRSSRPRLLNFVRKCFSRIQNEVENKV